MLITSAQSDGIALGDSLGDTEGVLVGERVGGSVIATVGAIGVGAEEGIAVGEQAGGLPSGDGVNIGLSGLHSSGQHVHPIPVG